MKIDKEVLALALLTAGEQAHAFSSFQPSAFTLKSFALKGSDGEIEQKLRDFRSGYLPATLWGVGLAAVVSYIAESPLPLLFSAGTAIAMIGLYEHGIPPERRLLGMTRCGRLNGLPIQYRDAIETPYRRLN